MVAFALENFQEDWHVPFARGRVWATGEGWAEEEVQGTGARGREGSLRRRRVTKSSSLIRLRCQHWSCVQYVILFFFKMLYSWERDARPAFLRVLTFLGLSEAEGHGVPGQTRGAGGLPRAPRGRGVRAGSLLCWLWRLSHSQALKHTSFRLCPQKGGRRKPIGKKYAKGPGKFTALVEMGERHVQTSSLRCARRRLCGVSLTGTRWLPSGARARLGPPSLYTTRSLE